jgi:hypothetical protein
MLHKDLPGELKHLPRMPNSAWAQLFKILPLPSGPARMLAISANHCTQIKANPDGHHVAALISRQVDGNLTDRIEIWDTEPTRLIAEISDTGHRIHRLEWVASGRWLMVLKQWGSRNLFWECFDLTGQSQYIVSDVSWDSMVSLSGDLIATIDCEECLKGSRRCSIRVLRTGLLLATLESHSILPKIRFVDEDHLLIADVMAGESVRIVRIKDQETLWKTTLTHDVREISWEPDWNAVVLHDYKHHHATVLSMSDGRQLPESGDVAFPWRNPSFMNQGRLALDPLFNSNIIQLRKTSTGRTIATFAAFADPEWIIYTPDGLWTGSSGVLDWVSFYRGIEPLSPDEIKELRQPGTVQARLAAAVREAP